MDKINILVLGGGGREHAFCWKLAKSKFAHKAITWKIDELKSRIYKINEIEFLIKSNSGKSLNLVSDFIVNF